MTRCCRLACLPLLLLGAVLARCGNAGAARGPPVVCVHGYNGTAADFAVLREALTQQPQPQSLYVLQSNDLAASLLSIAEQTVRALAELRALRTEHAAEFAAGFVLAGHSLGALVARSMLETEALPVLHYVSIAGVQSGLFVAGISVPMLGEKKREKHTCCCCCCWWLMGDSYGHCAQYSRTPNATCEMTTSEMYTAEAQATRAPANFWRTPQRARYLRGNTFLPVLNNEVAATTPAAAQRKANFLRAQRYTFLASPSGLLLNH